MNFSGLPVVTRISNEMPALPITAGIFQKKKETSQSSPGNILTPGKTCKYQGIRFTGTVDFREGTAKPGRVTHSGRKCSTSIPIHEVHGDSSATGKGRRGHTHESEEVMIVASVLIVVVDEHPHEDPLVLEVQQSRHVL